MYPCLCSYLGLFGSRAVDSRGQLHCGQRLHEVGDGVRDVSDHDGLAVDVSQRFTEQHGELTVPANYIKKPLVSQKASKIDSENTQEARNFSLHYATKKE